MINCYKAVVNHTGFYEITQKDSVISRCQQYMKWKNCLNVFMKPPRFFLFIQTKYESYEQQIYCSLMTSSMFVNSILTKMPFFGLKIFKKKIYFVPKKINKKKNFHLLKYIIFVLKPIQNKSVADSSNSRRLYFNPTEKSFLIHQ